jgi:hypothetical protein
MHSEYSSRVGQCRTKLFTDLDDLKEAFLNGWRLEQGENMTDCLLGDLLVGAPSSIALQSNLDRNIDPYRDGWDGISRRQMESSRAVFPRR